MTLLKNGSIEGVSESNYQANASEAIEEITDATELQIVQIPGFTTPIQMPTFGETMSAVGKGVAEKVDQNIIAPAQLAYEEVAMNVKTLNPNSIGKGLVGVGSALTNPAAVVVELGAANLLLSSCETDPKIDPIEQVNPNTEEAKLNWLKEIQAKDPSIKLDTRVILDKDHDFGIKYEITDMPYKFQIKEVTIYENSINRLRKTADGTLAQATSGKPTYDDLFIGIQFINKFMGSNVTFKINSKELYEKNQITLDLDDVNTGSSLSNSAVQPSSLNSGYIGRLSVAPKSSMKDIFWQDIASDKIYTTTNLPANSQAIPVGKDFNNATTNSTTGG